MTQHPISTARSLAETLGDTSTLTGADIAATYETFNAGDAGAQVAAPAAMMTPLAARDPGTDPLGVIVETREHPNLVPVTRQVLDQGIAVQIFHGTENADFVAREFAPEIAAGQVHLTAMDYAKIGRNDYNGLLLCRAFWEALISRGKILIFQTDAILCPASSFRLTDFLDFDYIGSAWGRRRKRGIVVDGGNGGFSVRDWTRSVDCLTRFPPETYWAGGEDSYFGFHLELTGGRVAQPTEAARFGTQFWFLENSFGTHKPEPLSTLGRALFLDWCPEAAMIFPPDLARKGQRLGRLLRMFGLIGPLTRAYRAKNRP